MGLRHAGVGGSGSQVGTAASLLPLPPRPLLPPPPCCCCCLHGLLETLAAALPPAPCAPLQAELNTNLHEQMVLLREQKELSEARAEKSAAEVKKLSAKVRLAGRPCVALRARGTRRQRLPGGALEPRASNSMPPPLLISFPLRITLDRHPCCR